MTTRANGENHHDHSDGQRRPPQPPHPQQRPPQRSHPPPPQPGSHYLAPYSSSSSSSSASLKGCCCCLFLLLTFLALLLVAATLVVVLVVKPKKPQFDLQQVGVSYLLVTAPPPQQQQQQQPQPSDGAAAAAYLTLNITMLFTAENPNKVGIRYEATAFTVMYRGVPLGVAQLPGFEQPAHSTRLVQTRVVVDRVNVLQADALQLVRDAAIDDRIDLSVVGDVAAKIRFLGLTSPRVQVSVDCAIVISPRKQSLTYKQCGVDGLNI